LRLKSIFKILTLLFTLQIAVMLATSFFAEAQQPARIQPPDILSEATDTTEVEAEAPPSNQNEQTVPTQSPRRKTQPSTRSRLQPPAPPSPSVSESTIDPIESDAEPVPIIKKNKSRIDRQARPESRYIEHPNADKGLIKIDKDKVYYYKVQSSEQKNAGNFKIAIYSPSNLENPNADIPLSYDSIYDDGESPLLLYEHEWQIWQKFGKFGLTAGGGFFFAEGKGQFANGNPERPKESFMLFVFPVHVGAIYRLQFTDGQRFVPYGGGGVGGMAFAERRDDDLNPTLGARLGFSPNALAYGGVAVQLGSGSRSFLDLDREYGINKFWLTAEYRTYIHFGGDYDFSGDAFNGGFTAEF
jgi:hypothetical protein